MAAVRTIHHAYATQPERVFTLLRDPNYLRQRCVADGDRNIRIETAEVGGALRVIVERDHTIDLPPFVRGFIRPTNRAVEIHSWRPTDDGWLADYVVTARGMPGTLGGSMRIASDGIGTLLETTFEVIARVPLIASKLENLMANGFADYLARSAAHTEAALNGTLDVQDLTPLRAELSA